MTPATPNVTAAQIIAVAQAAIALAMSFGLSITAEQSAAIIQLSTAIAVVLPLADAYVRRGRAIYYASINHRASTNTGE